MTTKTAKDDVGVEPTLCADIGASNVRAGVVQEGRVIHIVEQPIPALLRSFGGDMVLAVAEVLAEVGASTPAYDLVSRAGAVGPIGVGVPAIVLEDGSLWIGLSSGLPAGTTLRDYLSERFGTHVVVDNDAGLAALGELVYGAGAGEKSLALLTLGTNVGMGIVVDGRIYRGAHGAAGEIGTVPLPIGVSRRRDLIEKRRRSSDQPPPPDGYAWLEEVYGGQALADAWRMAASAGTASASLSMPRALQLATGGDEAAKEIVDDAVEGWALAIATTCAVLDPGVVLLSGGMAADLGPYLDQLRHALEGFMPGRPPRIEIAALGPSAGLIGAAAAARLSDPSVDDPGGVTGQGDDPKSLPA
jgi:predicted NBD/HSP70 family sugar kinase